MKFKEELFLNHLNNEINLCNKKLETLTQDNEIFYWETRGQIAELQKNKLLNNGMLKTNT